MRISDWSSDVCSSDLTGVGKGVGKVGADRRGFGDHHAAVLDRGHLAHRVDGQVLGRLHPGAVFLHHGAVRLAKLLQHPAHDAAAGLRVGVEDEFVAVVGRSEEHTSELQSLMRISYAVFCLKKKKTYNHQRTDDYN